MWGWVESCLRQSANLLYVHAKDCWLSSGLVVNPAGKRVMLLGAQRSFHAGRRLAG